MDTDNMNIAVDNGFDFSKDVKVEYGTKNIYIEFNVNKAEVSEAELKAEGCDVSGGVASKNTECETATYTFDKLPNTLEGIKRIPLDTKFAPMAACICAVAAFDNDKSRADIYMYSHPIFEMFDYLNGPGCEISNAARSGIFLSMRDTMAYGKYAYFQGAKPSNSYTPDKPYRFTLVESPYYIPAKESTIAYPQGMPERRMILISFEGDDSQRYVDTYHSSDGNWYCWDLQWQHLVAGMKPVAKAW